MIDSILTLLLLAFVVPIAFVAVVGVVLGVVMLSAMKHGGAP